MVKKSSAYKKDIFRTILKNGRRFLSIMVITTLGVMMFSGLKAACQDLRYSADVFFDSQHLHDLSVVSTLGLDENDLEALRNTEGIKEVTGVYSEELICTCAGTDQKTALTTMCASDIDTPYLLSGTMPQKDNEAAATGKFLMDTGASVGDTIRIEDEEAESSAFRYREFIITAEVTDIRNVNNPFGPVSYRDAASTADTVFVLPSAADTDLYTSVYLTLEGTEEMFCFSDEYTDTVEKIRKYIETYIQSDREKKRTEAIRSDALEQLEESEKEVYQELADARKKLEEAEKQWLEGKNELDDGRTQLEEGRRQADEMLAAAQKTINDSRALLEKEKKKFEETKQDLLKQIEELEQSEQQLLQAKEGLAQIDDGIAQIDDALAQLESEEVTALMNVLSQLPEDTKLEDLYDMLDEFTELIDTLEESGIEMDPSQIQEAAEQILEAKDEVLADHDILTCEDTETKIAALSQLDGETVFDESFTEEYDLVQLKETVEKYTPYQQMDTVQNFLSAYEQACSINEGLVSMFESEAFDQAFELLETLDSQSDLSTLAKEEIEQLKTLPEQLAEIAGMKTPQTVGELVTVYHAAIERLQSQREELLATRKQITDSLAENGIEESGIDEAIEQIRNGIRQIREGIASGEKQLADAQAQLDEAQRQLDASRISTYAQLNDLLAQIEAALNTLYEGRAELDSGWQEYRDGEKKAKEEFAEARKTIAEIDTAEWYILDRMDMSGYANIDSDASSIESIGTAFPIVFFIVAILMSLTAITRMVEEERGLIGTYKSLGYTDQEIRRKYLVYSFGACLGGTVIGTILAFAALPAFIFTIFSVMYLIPEFHLTFVPLYGIGGPLIFMAGICGAVIAAAHGELKQVPAALMRPVSPKAGSKVLLERITPVWKRLSFLNKVTARNLFRYKKRMLMTICGIAGCMALLLFGFSIGDSVHDLAPNQYENTFHYDILAAAQGSGYPLLIEKVEADEETGDYVQFMISTVKVSCGSDRQESMQIFVFEDNSDLGDYITLTDTDGNPVSLDDSQLLISLNAGDVLGFSDGDTVSLQLSDLQKADIRVDHLVMNYLGNYAYMNRSVYEKYFEGYAENALLINFENENTDGAAYAAELKGLKNILTVISTDEMNSTFSDAFKLIDAVVYIVIVMSAALAFVVLYTLSSINVSERTREIATIKVLGFFDHEVHVYIDKETIILTVIGIALGIPLGWLFAQSLTTILHLPSVYLAVSLHSKSYMIATGLCMVFALAVNLFSDRILDSIDPAEALKSIE